MSNSPTPKGQSNKGKPRPKPDHSSKNTGPGRPNGIKSTNEELHKRIRQAADLTSAGHRKTAVVDALCKEYGVSWQMAQVYVSRARTLLNEELNRPKDEHRSDVLGQYLQIRKDSKASNRDKISALAGVRDMLGLDAPKQVNAQILSKVEIEHSDPDMSTVEIRAAIARLEGKVKSNGKPDGNGEAHVGIAEAEAR